MAYACGERSPLNDACMLDSGHLGPHIAQDKAEWFGNVWVQEPAPQSDPVLEPEAQFNELVSRARENWHAKNPHPTAGPFALYDESTAKSPEQLAAMRRLNAAELERRRLSAETDQRLAEGEAQLQQNRAKYAKSMERALLLRKLLTIATVAFVLLAILLLLLDLM